MLYLRLLLKLQPVQNAAAQPVSNDCHSECHSALAATWLPNAIQGVGSYLSSSVWPGCLIYLPSTGKGEEFSHLDFATERMQRSKERTYQWLYTQVWDYEGASPRTEKW